MRSNAGFTIIESLVGIVLIGILCLGVMQFSHFHSEFQKAILQKNEVIDLQQSLMRAMEDTQTCTCLLNATFNTANSTPLAFDSSSENPEVQLDMVGQGCIDNKPALPLAMRNQNLPHSKTGLKVSDIKLTSIVPFGAPGSDSYLGIVEVQIDPSSTKIPIAPIRVHQRFTTKATDPATAKTVAACMGASLSPLLTTGDEEVVNASTYSKSIHLPGPGYLVLSATIRNAPHLTVLIKADGNILNQSSADSSGTLNGTTSEGQAMLAAGDHTINIEVWDGVSSMMAPAGYLDVSYSVFAY